MRGGVARWKRGVSSAGISSAVAYAMGGSCDASSASPAEVGSTIAAAKYAGTTVTRHSVIDGAIERDQLDVEALRVWFSGADPATGERRGRDLASPDNDMVLDATINAPKSFSLAAVLDEDLAVAYEALQDRLRDRVITMWQQELNARRGAGGKQREGLHRIEVVELQHERSRALDPHKHRHLWLNTKVQGEDRRWSNVDSRVMLRFQNIVNAEGELAARTDPEWVAALAAKGYTLDKDGEVAQLVGVVRPLSRRSNQIEANRAAKVAEWKKEHPGQEPDRIVLTAIDRWAWAYGRPDKPASLDEGDWTDMVRREIADIDPALVATDRPPVAPVPVAVAVADLDRDQLALVAVADADRRAATSGGRVSVFDIRAGAVRAVAATGVAGDHVVLAEVANDVTSRAVSGHTVSLLDEDTTSVPGHVKQLMATNTARLKTNLADTFDRLAKPGRTVKAPLVAAAEDDVLEEGQRLAAGQSEAAAAIGGRGRLVTVTGPAGTGKTTMLKVAKKLLNGDGRSLFIVAPTKKAASMAGRETRTAASSLHGLLRDHGYRWTDTEVGQTWTRLRPGDVDPDTGQEWAGPVKYPLKDGDRIVVDEAGMVDLHTATALAELAENTGAGVAMVGDHLQALPVGHSGAMSLMKSRSDAVVELTAIHRFKDPAWGELSLRIREPESRADADEIAGQILATGHADTVATDEEARERMVAAYFEATGRGESISIVTATHDEAQTIGENIQRRRVEAGQVDTSVAVSGQAGQVLYAGDVVQTRRNDSRHGVENRQLWRLRNVTAGQVVLASVADSAVTKTVPVDYVAEHVHLAYASTVYGAQGETTDRSIVGPGVDAAGLYVGLTRGRADNRAVVVANSETAAQAELAATMRRGQIEARFDDAKTAAAEELNRSALDTNQSTTTIVTVSSWDDKAKRPMGRIIDPAKKLETARAKAAKLRGQVETLADKIAADTATLRTVNVRIGQAEARGHAATATGAITTVEAPPTELAQTLADRIKTARAQHDGLVGPYRRASKRVTMLNREVLLRRRLPDADRAGEDRARLAAARQRRRDMSVGCQRPATASPTSHPTGRTLD